MSSEPTLAVGTADGTIGVYNISFNTVHGLYNDRYAFRQNMTDVIIEHLMTNQKAKIKCRDYIKKISVYKETLAVQLPGKVYIYELFYDDTDGMHYRIKEKMQRKDDCTLMVVTSNHVLFCHGTKIDMYSFGGELIHDWSFESIVRYIKVIGGPKNKEGMLVALKDGQVFKLFLDNPFPIPLIKHNFPVRCVDISLNRDKLAIVDDQDTCSVYNLSNKALMYQEPDTLSVSWNSEVDDAICFSSLNGLTVKIDQYVAYQQKIRGFVVGYRGPRVFYLENYNMDSIDIPHSVPLDGFLERSDFINAYRVASNGVPDAEWRKLGLAALEQMSLDVAKKAFSRIRDFKFLEAIRVIEKMKQDGRRETDLFQAEVYAYCENYAEVIKLVFIFNIIGSKAFQEKWQYSKSN